MDGVASELRARLLGAAIQGHGARYHLRELLGEGGQGWVYKASCAEVAGLWVVAKVLRPEAIQPDSLTRFEREAEVLRRLGSGARPNPNIVRYHDHGTHPVGTVEGELALPFIILEYVAGRTLANVVAARGGFGLPAARVGCVFGQIACALTAVHEHGIVHRDLKPSNVLLAQLQGREVAKVTDFGLAKLSELSAHRTAAMAGASADYAPPEQYEMGNNRVTVHTDVFSFAAILFECLSGRAAFPFKPGDNPLRIVARMLGGDAPSLAGASAAVSPELRGRPDIIAALDREIVRAVSPDPSRRHRSVRDLWGSIVPLLCEADDEGRASAHMTTCSAGDRRVVAKATIPEQAPGQRASGVGSPHPEAAGGWEWRTVSRAVPGERLRSAVFVGDRVLVAAGARGLHRLANGAWTAIGLGPDLGLHRIRGVSCLPTGDLLLFGDGALALSVTPSGAVDAIALGDQDVALLGAHAHGDTIAFVGERLSRAVGVSIEVSRGRAAIVTTLEGTARLHGVTRLARDVLLMCGMNGHLVHLARGKRRDLEWGRTGHLYAIARAAHGEAFAVGGGGHALRIVCEPDRDEELPRAALETVQTTRDLGCVTVGADGAAWAAGEQARVLVRVGATWTRVPLPEEVRGTIAAVLPSDESVVVVCESGVVLEGRRRS